MKILLSGILLLTSISVYAADTSTLTPSQMMQASNKDLTCYMVVSKSTCWGAYDVTISMYSVRDNKHIKSITLEQKNFHEKEVFPCKSLENISFYTTFTPTIWSGQEGKRYPGIKIWQVPLFSKLKERQQRSWTVNTCFPKDFASAPIPVKGYSAGCRCEPHPNQKSQNN